ncbi:hypothetical protein NDU88_000801, partial [Pleurodeles waltl]
FILITVHRLHRLHSCYNTIIWIILLQKRHLGSQSQIMEHGAGDDDVAHLLRSTSGRYTGGFRHLLICPSRRCLRRTTAKNQSLFLQ